MALISCNVEANIAEWKKRTGINWHYVIMKGVEAIQNAKAQEEFMQEYKELKEKQARTAALLQQYVAISNNSPLPLEPN